MQQTKRLTEKERREAGLRQMREGHEAYLQRIIKEGGKITTYTCQHCGDAQKAVQPRPEQTNRYGNWNGAKTCVNCGKTNFVHVWPDGHTTSEPI